MATLLSTLTSIVSSVAGMVSTWLGVVFATGNEYLQLCAIIGFVGVGIGALKRLTRI